MASDTVIKTMIAEAGGDPKALAAVAAVINNRAVKQGKTPEQIVKAKGQFEGYSNPGSKSRAAQKDSAVVARAREVWNGVKSGTIADPTNGGTFYHADYVSPYWAKSANKNGSVNIGGNIFYKGSGAIQSAPALEAINRAVPMPVQRPDPVALGYADSPSIVPLPRVRPDPVTSPPQMAQMPPLTAIGRAGAGSATGTGSASLYPFGVKESDYAPVFRGSVAANGAVGPSATGNGNAALSILPGISASGAASAGTGASGSANPNPINFLPSPGPLTPPSPPLISRSVQTVPIDPRTGMPVSNTPSLQSALGAYAANRADPSNQATQVASLAPQGMMTAIGNARAGSPGWMSAHLDGSSSTPSILPQTAQPGMFGRSTPSVAPTPMSGRPNDIIQNVPYVPPVVPKQNYTDASSPLDNQYLGLPNTPPAVQAINNAVPMPRSDPRTVQVLNPAYTQWQASQTPALKQGQSYTSTGSIIPTSMADAMRAVPSSSYMNPVSKPTIAPPKYIPQTIYVKSPAAIPLSTLGTVNPASQIVPRVASAFNSTPIGHIASFVQGQPVQGGLLSLLTGGGPSVFQSVFGNHPANPSFASTPTIGQQANNLNNEMSHNPGSGSFGVGF